MALLALLALPACSIPLPSPIAAPAPVPAGERDGRYEACRAEATRVVQFRERGQQMRTDEMESSRGTLTVAPFSRLESDRGAAQIDRDRMIAECLRSGARTGAAGNATPGASGRR
ncbi:hypothetical protein [Falsiroseomonas selenitidurans]|uniref:Lipoprotein n=1 Tax=Falsiroseomonas selenitidurans TaxID=2716335 RepID=A0ABX1E322_9PROT|nr:hypothetical protein [Falsiroseomonas selenitidurans]NKC31576.1 hypothetical protein [Falsiroseomonas selenitidurans]